ncbi:MAG: HD domain-containing protein [Candidatus Marinimicrobia bacterium]|nr:HD domain-containing protein [Candidatus Neomarinimicrobiota bacterium]
MRKIFIEDMKPEAHIEGYFGLKHKNVRTTKNDKLYLDLVLVDKSGEINAKMWDGVKEVKDSLIEGKPVAVKGYVSIYSKKLQLTIKKIRPVNEEDHKHGYKFQDLVLSSDKDIDKIWSEIQDLIKSIKNIHLRELTNKIYQEYEDELKTYPASMKLHHAYRGGLLEHVHLCAKNAMGICHNYPELDLDLVLSGILLHDIGKIEELTSGINIKYTDRGNFSGHLVIGWNKLNKAINEIEFFPEELRNKLEHILLSHHGKMEWGSPIEPAFPEAAIVFYADKIDTYLKQMKNAINQDESEENWTDTRNYFRRPLYKKQ